MSKLKWGLGSCGAHHAQHCHRPMPLTPDRRGRPCAPESLLTTLHNYTVCTPKTPTLGRPLLSLTDMEDRMTFTHA